MPDAWNARVARPDSFQQVGWLIYEHAGRAMAANPGLNASQAFVHALYELRAEVNADGFESYFSYDYGDRAVLALEAARAVGAPGWCDLIGEAVAIFATPYPWSAAERQELVDGLLDADEDVFNRLDDKLYDLEVSEPLDILVDRYVEQHAGELFDPPAGD